MSGEERETGANKEKCEDKWAKVWETGSLSTIQYGVMKVNRHAYNLSFYTCQDALRSMKRTGQTHDTLPGGRTTGKHLLSVAPEIWIAKEPTRQMPTLCEGERLTFTSPHWPQHSCHWSQRQVWAKTYSWERRWSIYLRRAYMPTVTSPDSKYLVKLSKFFRLLGYSFTPIQWAD